MNKEIDTGLCDSNGAHIFVGDKLKREVECNQDVHGEWAVYEVRQQGLTPIIAYLHSEKGEILPEGYLAMPLCDDYNRKLFSFAKDVSMLRPEISSIIWNA